MPPVRRATPTTILPFASSRAVEEAAAATPTPSEPSTAFDDPAATAPLVLEPPPLAADALPGLFGAQAQVLTYASEAAEAASEAALPALRTRVLAMGFSLADFDALLDHLRQSPATVTFHPEDVIPGQGGTPDRLLIEVFTEAIGTDAARYMNQFETGRSNADPNDETFDDDDLAGGNRVQVEARLFNNLYETGRAADPEDGRVENARERAKYFAWNVANTGYGAGGGQYGEAYLETTPAMLPRMTFTSVDSLVTPQDEVVATRDHFAHLLNRYTDQDLRMIMEVAQYSHDTRAGVPEGERRGRERGTRLSGEYGYAEAQVHSDLPFDSRVFSRLVVRDTLRDNPNVPEAQRRRLVEGLRAFSSATGIQLMWLNVTTDFQYTNDIPPRQVLVDVERITPDVPDP